MSTVEDFGNVKLRIYRNRTAEIVYADGSVKKDGRVELHNKTDMHGEHWATVTFPDGTVVEMRSKGTIQ